MGVLWDVRWDYVRKIVYYYGRKDARYAFIVTRGTSQGLVGEVFNVEDDTAVGSFESSTLVEAKEEAEMLMSMDWLDMVTHNGVHISLSRAEGAEDE